MKISIVVPNYNDSRIERTIKSIVNQNYSNYELIIVEGCEKNDNTSKIYEKYDDNISKLLVQNDDGIFDALNKGLELATGDYILLIGSDDRLSDHKDIFDIIIKNDEKNIHGFCLECHFVDESDNIKRVWKPGKITKQKIRWGILPPHFSLFLKKSIYQEIGNFELVEEKLGIDSRWLLNLLRIKNLNIKTIQERATLMQLGGVSTISIPNILKGNINAMKEARKMGLINWPLIPVVKIISKIPQYLFKN